MGIDRIGKGGAPPIAPEGTANERVEKTSLFGTAVHAVMKDRSADAATLSASLREKGVDVSSIAAVTPSLEDVFLDVVERVGAA